MDVFHLYQTVICFLTVWTIGLAVNCNNNQFERNGLCCDVCPPGKYVKETCTKDKTTVCVNCPEGYFSEYPDRLQSCLPCLQCEQDYNRKCTLTTNAKCSCRSGFRCSDHVCSKCEEDKKCQKGEELKMTGSRDYSFKCEPCPDNTYSDTREGICKQFTRCGDIGLAVGFPGNKTHNSNCHAHAHAQSGTLQITAIGLFLFAFALLIFLSQTCIKKIRQRKRKARNCPVAIISANVPETSWCPLSKEEIGNQLIQQIKLNSIHNSVLSLEHQQTML
ncbi:tumor necrosis factor receptor superfamily member 18 [Osmerus eperlanus]|uniref:tumor necrosis factor receptor superfamily member 18 n=1 Tax=Osmerus eperlanus TaxID=29151 RepID=UPI002E10CF07